MITTAQLVEEAVVHSPFLEEGLARGIINFSALARLLKPQFEARLYKDLEVGSIVMALKRYSQRLALSKHSQLEQILKQLGDTTVRSNIVSFTFANSSTLLECQRKLFQIIDDRRKSDFITFSQGVFETAFFASANIEDEIETIFQNQTLKNKQNKLSSITIIIPEEATKVAGVYYSILKVLAFEGINFVEVVSSFTELTIFLSEKDVDKAFSALRSFN